MRIGANYRKNGECEFIVWAPFLRNVQLKIVSHERYVIQLEKDSKGYWRKVVGGIQPDTLYFYYLNDQIERPDPASHYQPQGVHGPSQVVDHSSFNWEDGKWRGIPLSEMIIYELHVGTFTPEGTFDAVITRLSDIKEIGINVIEIMPVAQFPGNRNWGYDGTYPFAVQNSYGGPVGLKRLVNECHKVGIAVILDVVYNHLGPEGNYLWDFGPYFTDRYKTPWGMAINYDGAYSSEVRNFFIQNSLHWFRNYHIDGLRIDAIHVISDSSAKPFLQELTEKVEEFSLQEGRKYYLIAESDLNDSKVIKPKEIGGFGFDAQWCDDFHHALHTLVTGEKDGYYIDFGRIYHLKKALKEGFVYSGQYSEYRKRNHGNSSKERPSYQFIVFSQNHDQIGNRMCGERLTNLVSFESLKLIAGAVILSPYIPLLFMGEEYGEEAPFLYFTSYSDNDLIESIKRRRKEEFKNSEWKGKPPDPNSEKTFITSKINWEKRNKGKYNVLLNFYKSLIRLRKEIPALSNLDRESLDVYDFGEEKILLINRWKEESHVFIMLNFEKDDRIINFRLPKGIWKKFLDSSDSIWSGPGTLLPDRINQDTEIILRGQSLVIYSRLT